MNSELMNQKLAEIALPLAQKFANDIDKVVSAIEQQFPILIQEILRWEFGMSMIWFFWALFCLFGAILLNIWYTKLLKKNWVELEKDMKSDIPVVFLPYLFGNFAISLPAIINIFSNLSWLKIYLAPRLYLIEYVTNLIKK